MPRACAVRLPGPAAAARCHDARHGRTDGPARGRQEERHGGMAALVLGSHSTLWWKGHGEGRGHIMKLRKEEAEAVFLEIWVFATVKVVGTFPSISRIFFF